MSTLPQFVIYYSNQVIPLKEAANRLYTDIILAFLIPESSGSTTIVLSGNLDSAVLNDIKAVQAAGKRVLISFGGETVTNADYTVLSQHVDDLASQIAGYVVKYNLDGTDLDYEDTAALQSNTGYNGVDFISALTNALHDKLPGGKQMITHAPQPPYLCAPEKPFNCQPPFPYGDVLAKTGGNIGFLNMQYYNNEWYTEPPSKVVTGYEQAVAGWQDFAGLSATRLLVGKPVSKADAGSGWLPPGKLISEIINPLRQKYPNDFGGVMGWEFSSDTDGSWSQTIGRALWL